MKQLCIFSLIVAVMFVATSGDVFADTTVEQGRTTITRSGGPADTQERAERTRANTPREDIETPHIDGDGTVFNATYSSENGITEVESETTGDPSSADITVIINGELVTGGQNQENDNTPEDGADGEDGPDGNDNDGEDETNVEEPDDEEEGGRNERPARPTRSTR